MNKNYDHEKKKKKLLEDIEKDVENYNTTIEYLGDVGEVVSDIIPKLIEHKNKLGVQKQIIKNGVVTNFTPTYMGTFDAYYFNINRDIDYSNQLRENVKNLKSNVITIRSGHTTTGRFVQSLTASGAISVSEGFDNWNLTLPLVKSLQEPSPLERKKELISKLKKEDTECEKLIKHIESAWNALYQENNPDKFVHIGQSLRQFINKMLGHLAPDNKVMGLPNYFSERQDGKGPSRSQRTRYAIQGINTIIKEEDLDIIEDIIKRTSKEFDNLSKLAKERNVGDLEAYSKRVINDVQILFINLLDARSIYFKE